MKQKKVCIIVVLVMAGWGLYILLLPLISPIMGNLFPVLWQCQYKRITGRECPFCGITRDGGTFYSTGQFGELNGHSSIYFIICMGIVVIGLVACIALILLTKVQNKKLQEALSGRLPKPTGSQDCNK